MFICEWQLKTRKKKKNTKKNNTGNGNGQGNICQKVLAAVVSMVRQVPGASFVQSHVQGVAGAV